MIAGALVLVLLALARPAAAQGQSGPQVTITQPTTASTYSTTATQLTVAGTAQGTGNRTITLVTWRTDRGAMGTAQGTAQWTFPVTLGTGTTQLTVSATDSQNRQGSDTLTVMLTGAPPPPLPITLEWEYTATAGDSFEITRCLVSGTTCGSATTVASVGIQERSWVDTMADSQVYGYRILALAGGTVLGVSAPCIVNQPCPP